MKCFRNEDIEYFNSIFMILVLGQIESKIDAIGI